MKISSSRMNIYQLTLVQKWRDYQDLSPASYNDVEIAYHTMVKHSMIPEEMIGIIPENPEDKVPEKLKILFRRGGLYKIADRYNEMIPRHNQHEEIDRDTFNKFFESLGRLDLP